VFCALAVTVKRSAVFFTIFGESECGSFSSFGVCLEGDDQKGRQLEEKVHPGENPGYTCEFAHP